jgi:hypothetical protein
MLWSIANVDRASETLQRIRVSCFSRWSAICSVVSAWHIVSSPQRQFRAAAFAASGCPRDGHQVDGGRGSETARRHRPRQRKATQDFVLISSPAFFVDLVRYNKTLRQFLSGGTIAQYMAVLQLSGKEIWIATKVNRKRRAEAVRGDRSCVSRVNGVDINAR